MRPIPSLCASVSRQRVFLRNRSGAGGESRSYIPVREEADSLPCRTCEYFVPLFYRNKGMAEDLRYELAGGVARQGKMPGFLIPRNFTQF